MEVKQTAQISAKPVVVSDQEALQYTETVRCCRLTTGYRYCNRQDTGPQSSCADTCGTGCMCNFPLPTLNWTSQRRETLPPETTQTTRQSSGSARLWDVSATGPIQAKRQRLFSSGQASSSQSRTTGGGPRITSVEQRWHRDQTTNQTHHHRQDSQNRQMSTTNNKELGVHNHREDRHVHQSRQIKIPSGQPDRRALGILRTAAHRTRTTPITPIERITSIKSRRCWPTCQRRVRTRRQRWTW